MRTPTARSATGPANIGHLTLAGYALLALPMALIGLPFYVLAPAYYVETLHVPVALAGQALLLARLADALSDPVAGLLADRWRPKAGRRRLWVLAASFPAALAVWMVFTPPAGAGALYLGLMGAATSVLMTACMVPYAAWGAELLPDYAGRARVAAWREAFGLVGVLIALGSIAALPLLGLPGPGHVLAFAGLVAGVGLPTAAALAFALVPEPRDVSTRRLPLAAGLAALGANRPFLRLLAAYFLNGFANGLPATLFLFFVSERLAAPQAAGPLLVLYFLCGLAGMPLWLLLAHQSSKHRAWCLAMLMACGFFGVALTLGPGDTLAFGVICAGSGLGLGADLLLAPAIQADVIDVGTLATGEQRSGLYFAVWGLSTKLALAAAAGLAFPLLSAFGFDPAAGARAPQGLLALSLLYAGLPVALKLTAVALMWNFTVSPELAAANAAALSKRADAGA